MDAASIVAIVIAVIAALPGLISLYNQGKKDRQQLEIDKEKARVEASTNAQESLMSLLKPLREEVGRLQKRVAELEEVITEKNTKIDNLEQAVFDRDVKIRTMQFTIDGLKSRLEEMEDASAKTPAAKKAIKQRREEGEAIEESHKLKAIEEVTAELHLDKPPCGEVIE